MNLKISRIAFCELVFWLLVECLVIFNLQDFATQFQLVSVSFIFACVVFTLLPQQIRFMLPILLYQGTGLIRFLIIPLVMKTEKNPQVSGSVAWMFEAEIITVVLAVFFYSYRNRNENYNVYEKTVEDVEVDFKAGLISVMVLISGFVLILLNRNILMRYLVFSTNKVVVQYSSGAVALLISAFFVILYILSIKWIHKIVKTKVLQLLLLGLVSLVFMNGSAITGADISRWTLLISGYISYIFISAFVPKYKRFLVIVAGAVIILTVTFGTMMKFAEGNSAYSSMRSTIDTMFGYNSLNAYFCGPKNCDIGFDMINALNGGRSVLGMIRSDIFANFPMLNKVLSSVNLQTTHLFNLQYYGSTIASDQIIPISVQFFVYFKFLFVVPYFIVFYNAMKLYSKLKKEKNMLLIYCLAYMTFSFSLVNCISFTNMMQNLWIHVLPIYLIYIINNRRINKNK